MYAYFRAGRSCGVNVIGLAGHTFTFTLVSRLERPMLPGCRAHGANHVCMQRGMPTRIETMIRIEQNSGTGNTDRAIKWNKIEYGIIEHKR